MFDLKQIQKMQQEMQGKMGQLQEEMDKMRVEGSSGGGVVKVTMNGNQQVLGIKIQPDAVDPDDIEMLEDLITAAVNAAVEKSKEASQSGMSQLTGGFKIPGLTM